MHAPAVSVVMTVPCTVTVFAPGWGDAWGQFCIVPAQPLQNAVVVCVLNDKVEQAVCG